MYKKVIIIFNPKSDQGRKFMPFLKRILGIRTRKFDIDETKEETIKRIKDYLNEYGIIAESRATDYPGHARELALEAAANSYDLVIAAGGDGTINEIVNGLAGSKTVLGVIPMGTANIFALELDIPMEYKEACQRITQGTVRTIDLGKCNGRYFVCMAGIGFDAQVIREADSKHKKVLGVLAYIFIGIKMLFVYTFRKILVKIDNQPIVRKGYFVIVSNGKYYGSNIVSAPKADLSDGYLDICIFKHNNMLSILAYLFGPARGKIDKHVNLEYFQCKKISILKKGKHPVHVDAEYLCETPVDIEVCPGALRVIA